MIRGLRLKLISEYKAKCQCYFELIGRLYPSIVYNELQQMREHYQELGGDILHMPDVPTPRADGSAPSPYTPMTVDTRTPTGVVSTANPTGIFSRI